MMSRMYVLGSALWIALGLATPRSFAAELMVGVTPADGGAQFVKKFSVKAGTTILGVEFENNDAQTVYPEVALVSGDVSSALGEGVVVRTAGNVSEAAGGSVQIFWSEPVQAVASEDYYVAVRMPAGQEKEGPGRGPAIGASDATAVTGSFLASGIEGSLTRLKLDLAVKLLTTGVGKAVADGPHPPTQQVVQRTFLAGGTPNPFNPNTRIAFGVDRVAEVELSIFDVAGRLVRTLVREQLAAGVYERRWDGRDDQGLQVAAGIYMTRLRVGSEVITQKLVLTK